MDPDRLDTVVVVAEWSGEGTHLASTTPARYRRNRSRPSGELRDRGCNIVIPVQKPPLTEKTPVHWWNNEVAAAQASYVRHKMY